MLKRFLWCGGEIREEPVQIVVLLVLLTRLLIPIEIRLREHHMMPDELRTAIVNLLCMKQAKLRRLPRIRRLCTILTQLCIPRDEQVTPAFYLTFADAFCPVVPII